MIQVRSGDPNIGPKLPTLLRRAGIQDIELNVIQPAHVRGEGKSMALLTMARISDALTREGLATAREVQQILTELRQAAENRETVISLPRVFQVWGRRAS